MALYRKYRPATFAEVVGQEHVTEPLSTALSAGRINHAYLFSGPRGCGKTSSARILARSLNCEQGPTPTPCGVCDSCVALAPNGGGSVDVVELDAASHGGVDDTRELRDRAFYAPAQSRYRIFIIDEAHMVTTAGFNALLKIVEEPPEHLIFVFATTEPEKVLPTIRSRTHHYPFRLLAPRTMRGLIEKILESEHVEVDDVVFPLVIRAGGGSPRDTLSVLDQLLAGAEDNRVHYQRALALLGATDVALIDDAVDALAAGDAPALFGAVESVIDAGHDPRRFAIDLLERFRDLIVLQAVPDAASRGVVDAPGDVLERMRDQAERVGSATLARYAEVVHAGLGEMRGATAPRLLLEVVCARLLLPSASDTESALLQRIERIETRLDISIPAGEAAAGSAAPAAARQYQRRTQAAPPAEAEPVEQPVPKPAVSEPVAVKPEVPQPKPVSAEPVEPAAAVPEPPVPAAPTPTHPAPAPQAAPPVAAEHAVAGEPDAAAVRQVWSTVREKVRDRSRSTEAMLASAIVRAVEGDTLVLSHPAAPLAKRLAEQHNADVIREALKDVLGVNWRVRCDVGGSHPSLVAEPEPPAPQPDPVETQRAEEEELIAEAVRDDADPAPRRDPEEVALEILQTELGARKIDG
ncbi:MAG: DNA polymerase III subunits gamma/tau [Mycobacterium sp.]